MWLTRVRFLILLISGLPWSPVAWAADPVVDPPVYWMSEQYPPYNFTDEQGIARGIAVETLAAMYAELGRPEVTVDFLPWARAYALLKRKAGTALFSMTYTPERQRLFRFVGPIISTRVAVLAPRAAQLNIVDGADLGRLRIGVIRADIGELLLNDLGIDPQHIVYSNDAKNLIQLLHRGRVDAIAYSDDVAAWNMRQAGIDPQRYVSVYTLLEGDLGFAFHPQVSADRLDRFQQALEALKDAGVTDRIRQKYLGMELEPAIDKSTP